jgi:hypothetical protein
MLIATKDKYIKYLSCYGKKHDYGFFKQFPRVNWFENHFVDSGFQGSDYKTKRLPQKRKKNAI